MMRFALPLCVALGHAGLAHAADTERIRELLRVRAGATCLTTETLVVQVEQWLHDAPIAGDFTIAVDGSATDPRSARLRVMRGGRVVAHRAFEPGPARCSHLRAAVGLAVALAIKATLLEELGRPLPEDPAARAHAWSVASTALGTYRLLPDLAPGIELSLRRGLGDGLSLRLGVLGVAAFAVPLERRAGSFDATLAGARADACARSRLAPVVLAGVCIGMLGGALYAVGADVADPESSVVGLFALSNALELELEMSTDWSLALGLSMSFLLHPVRVGLRDAGGTPVGAQALKSPAFALGLGPVYHF